MRLDEYAPRPAHLRWLLDSDPAIRWQVMRDLTDENPDTIAAERSRIASQGWGAQLLARPVAVWQVERRKLTTLNTLVVLRDLGLDPASKQARKMVSRVKKLRFKWHSNRLFFRGETEPCINGNGWMGRNLTALFKQAGIPEVEVYRAFTAVQHLMGLCSAQHKRTYVVSEIMLRKPLVLYYCIVPDPQGTT